MFTKYLSRLSAALIVATVMFSASGCNKSTASVPDASSVEAGSTVETDTIETTGTAETSGENLVSTEAATSKSDASKPGTSETEKSNTDAANKNTESDSTKASDKTESATTKAAGTSTTEATTNTEESTSKAVVTETTTQASATAPTTAPDKKQEETTTQTPTEKQTEKTTQAPTKPAHTHSYTSAVTKSSTCTSEGVMTFTCSCGDSYTETIGRTAHNYGSYTYNNDATYESDGTETAVCSVCGDRTTRTAGGTKLVHVHNYSESVTTAPSCTTEGVKTFTCSCGSSYTEAIPAAGHDWNAWHYNNDATNEHDGTQTRTCLTCYATETMTAEGTKKNLPSWYDEHPDIPLNTRMGAQDDGSLEAYYIPGEFSFTDAALGCWGFGYGTGDEFIGNYAEGSVYHGYLISDEDFQNARE